MVTIIEQESSLSDSEMLNRAMHHKIANEIVILKSIAFRILHFSEGEDSLLSSIIKDIENVFEQIDRFKAEQKSKIESFDVIISDMRMEEDDSGFTIVERVKELNLSSVVIILTANDTVTDCRNALKMGAWDYMPKKISGSVFEALHQSIQEAIVYFNRWGNVQNEQWIKENQEDLENNYWGQYIAVINRNVIDAADS